MSDEKSAFKVPPPHYMFIYGAGRIGRQLANSHINAMIKGFIDKNARQIKTLTNGYGQTWKVFNVEYLNQLHVPLIKLVLAIKYDEKYEKIIAEIEYAIDNLNVPVSLIYLNYDEYDNTGCVIIDNRAYCLKKEKWLLGNPYESRKAYSYKNQTITKEYLRELYQEPVQFSVSPIDEQCILPDYESRYVNHKNGVRVTEYGTHLADKKVNKIFILGDSRVSGMLLEDSDTICSFVQLEINRSGLLYRVENRGISGRSIERMAWQTTHLSIQENDIVLFITGCYEYDIKKPYISFGVWFKYIEEANELCKRKNATFMYFHVPPTYELRKRTPDEDKVLNLITGTKFVEYKMLDIAALKEYFRMLCIKNGIIYFDLTECIEMEENRNYYIDVHHFGPNGNNIIAKYIIKKIQTLHLMSNDCLNNNIESEKIHRQTDFENKVIKQTYFSIAQWADKYRDIIKIKEDETIGAIVMNANPFHKGHMALVEYARQSVDKLIIFLLEEDASFFSYETRKKIVEENLKDYDDVFVVPSGKYIISRFTFPEYFKKEEMQNQKIDTTNDVAIFGRYIAPVFNISKRFVGSEPEDKITEQYNRKMKVLLETFGVELIIMDRIKNTKGYVSGTVIRKLFGKKDFEMLREYVSDITVNILKTL